MVITHHTTIHDRENIGCLALKNGNNIKHYMIKMKADIKLFATSFSVVTLPVFFRNDFLY
jgi:hypothetical protein